MRRQRRQEGRGCSGDDAAGNHATDPKKLLLQDMYVWMDGCTGHVSAKEQREAMCELCSFMVLF